MKRGRAIARHALFWYPWTIIHFRSAMALQSHRIKTIFTISLPIIGGMVSQNVLNIVDTAMVGQLGDAALAAAGMGGFITFMCQAIILGLSAGVQALAARRKGEGNDSEAAVPLNAGLIAALIIGLPLSGLLYFLAEPIFSLANSDESVLSQGIPYLEARMFGITAVGINFAFRGFWNGVNQTTNYLKAIVLMHIVNLSLNYLLIFGKFGFPALGVEGSGLGTTIALYVCSSYYLIAGYSKAKPYGFLRIRPRLATIKTVLRVSIPNGLQMLFFAAGFTALYWIIGLIGTKELAAANVIINISMVCILPGIAFGLTAASLVGQSLGRGDPDEADRWAMDVVKVAVFTLFLLGLPMLINPTMILRQFISNPETVDIAISPLRIAGGFMAVEGIGMVLLNAQLGAGDSRRVMVVSTVVQWLIFLPAAYFIGPVLGFGLTAVWFCQAGYRGLLSVAMTVMWKRKAWASVNV